MSTAMAALDRQVSAAKSVASQAIVRDKLDKTKGADSVGEVAQDALNTTSAKAGESVKDAEAMVSGEDAVDHVEEADSPLGNNLDVSA